MFRTVTYKNFKGLTSFKLHLKDSNVLVGPNNAGKSTALDGFRALAGALRFARRYRPTIVQNSDGRDVQGYIVPTSSIPIGLSNIHTNREDIEAEVHFTLKNGDAIWLRFPSDGGCYLCLDPSRAGIATISQFARRFPIDIAVVPTLGPFEEDEPLLQDETVKIGESTRRAHRMFRNIWYRRRADFDKFREIVATTWPGLEVYIPVVHDVPAKLFMLCREEGRDREVFWSGFGFQVWLQFLTHLIANNKNRVLVVDEADIYLHPDLQKKMFSIAKDYSSQLILATHSVEIINEAEIDDIVVVDKHKSKSARLNDIESLQSAIDSIGSTQNIYLARLSKGKRIVFVEGDDFKLLRKFGRCLELRALALGGKITPVAVSGFSQNIRATHAAWAFKEILHADMSLFALCDGDYRCDEEIEDFLGDFRRILPLSFVLERKEIENYLLIPEAIVKALKKSAFKSRKPVKWTSLKLIAQRHH